MKPLEDAQDAADAYEGAAVLFAHDAPRALDEDVAVAADEDQHHHPQHHKLKGHVAKQAIQPLDRRSSGRATRRSPTCSTGLTADGLTACSNGVTA